MFSITVRFLSSLQISYIFQDNKNSCCSIIGAGFGEYCAVFMQPISTDWAFTQSHSCFLHSGIPYILYTSHSHHFLSEFLEFGLWSIWLNSFCMHLAFCFFLWMTGELVRTSPRRLFVALHGPEFDNFGGGNNFWEFWLAFLSEKPEWVLMDGRTQEWRHVIWNIFQ
jgi:hypothetical protein